MPRYRQIDEFDEFDSQLRKKALRSTRFKRTLAIIFVIVCVTSLLVAIAFATRNKVVGLVKTTPASAIARHPTIVETTCGLVYGTQEKGIYVFKGVPYAVPPTGRLRWKTPVPIETTVKCHQPSSVTQAFSFGSMCAQMDLVTDEIKGSEDCLFINVWSPNTDKSASLDVMVWFHGGGLVTGSGNHTDLSPNADIAREAGKVFVSFNYRLNAFGFLALPELAMRQNRSSGNYGVYDQILALKWVQRNIRNFGGDPGKVTAFGLGSGGTCIHALLSMPRAHGLFHRAWISGPSVKPPDELTQAYEDNQIFLRSTKCHKAKDARQCLTDLPMQKVLRSIPWDEYPFWRGKIMWDLPTKDRFQGSLLVVDGYLIQDDTSEAHRSGIINDIPLLIGNTAQEADLRPAQPVNTWKWKYYEYYVRHRLGTFGRNVTSQVLKLYPPGKKTPEYQFTSLVSDVRAICPASLLARVAEGTFESPVYSYVATSTPSKFIRMYSFPARYAFHGWDMLAFFGRIHRYIFRPNDKDRAFKNNIRAVVFQFVARGRLERWSTVKDSVALISSKIRFNQTYRDFKCSLWTNKGLIPDYSWVN